MSGADYGATHVRTWPGAPVADHGVLFSAPMIIALKCRRKTQTRRLAKPRWKPGDTLWVRENFRLKADVDRIKPSEAISVVHYEADGPPPEDKGWGRLRPSIHLPRSATRMTMTVLAVRQEPLMDIMPLDAIAEGIAPGSQTAEGIITSWLPVPGAKGQTHMDPRDAYYALWDMINGEGAAALNPMVWVTVFSPPRL